MRTVLGDCQAAGGARLLVTPPRSRQAAQSEIRKLFISEGIQIGARHIDLHCPWDFERIADTTVLQRPEGISAIIEDGKVIDRGTADGPNKLREELGRSRAFC
jgi:hypothetical protein